MKFYVKQKVFSLRDSFNVYDENQKPVYRVTGKFISLRNKIEFMDHEGKLLYCSDKKILSILPQYFIYDPTGQQVVSVKKKFSIKPKFHVNIFGEEAKINGSFWQYNFEIETKNGIVATIRKKIISFGDSYEIDIADNEKNFELLLYLVIVIDQVLHEDKNHGAGSVND